ncbi:hypothetical protein NMK54_01840 [Nocardia otitidiscaviarum]|uniref:hypothetical protein n=1 Tax=Nocardia otitidiscaviarum TaxID=1823 RepID=UPI00163DBDF9|nr:hypothetical protein [Nocardia otitidiscaviarum]MCP9618905.1 hypothetical protein [Nocardia otitidiscaviarum]
MAASYRPSRRAVAKGLLVYPAAPVSYWAGGVRGLARLTRDVITGHERVQQRTREGSG